MDQIDNLLCQMLDDVGKVADQSGISKCILIARIYETMKSLDRCFREQADLWREEKQKLEGEIQELKVAISSKNDA